MILADLDRLLVSPTTSIRETIAVIDRAALGIALMVDSDRRLLATVTDGDIRRAILNNVDVGLPIEEVTKRHAIKSNPNPVVLPVGTGTREIARLMGRHRIRHIPLLDDQKRVQALAVADMLQENGLSLQAVVMAGGYGKRLRPLTQSVPKPMVPVGDRPLLEHIVAQLSDCGIKRVNITTHYKKEIIEQHFGDGSSFGVEVQYLAEDEPRGTAGALCLLEPEDQPILVINGDILTGLDFRAMLDFHRQHDADLTIGLKKHIIEVPYGVVKTDGVYVQDLSEKPILEHFVNAGIYLLSPQVCRLVPKGVPYDMTDLIQHLLSSNMTVVSFPIREYWLDIGDLESYQTALEDVKAQRIRLTYHGG